MLRIVSSGMNNIPGVILNPYMETIPQIAPTLLIPKLKLKAQMPTQIKGLHLGPNWGQTAFIIYYNIMYLYIYNLSLMDRPFRCEFHGPKS